MEISGGRKLPRNPELPFQRRDSFQWNQQLDSRCRTKTSFASVWHSSLYCIVGRIHPVARQHVEVDCDRKRHCSKARRIGHTERSGASVSPFGLSSAEHRSDKPKRGSRSYAYSSVAPIGKAAKAFGEPSPISFTIKLIVSCVTTVLTPATWEAYSSSAD